MTGGDTLDQRYLEFARRTTDVFARYPELEPVRYDIFRNVLLRRRLAGWRESGKRWIRPLVRRHRTRGPLPTSDILVWIEGERPILLDTVLPVADQLRRGGERVLLVSFNGPAGLPDDAVTCRCPSVWSSPAWSQAAWQDLSRTEPGVGGPGGERSFVHACADSHAMLREVHRIMEAVKPRVVVTASTQLIGGCAAVVAARQHGARSVLLQHGLLQPLYVPLLADVMCTWGPSSSDTLIRLGVDPERLIPLGSPRHDAMTPDSGTAKQTLLRSLNLPARPTVVFFSNGNDLQRNGTAPQECAEWLETLARAFRPRLNVIVKLHPNEDGTLYRGCSHLVVTREQPDAASLLKGGDAVLSLCSTALYEAILFGKPVWQLAAPGWPDLADNWKQGVAKRVASQAELHKLVEGWLDAAQPDRLTEWPVDRIFKNHGHAARAVAHYIRSHVHEPQEQEEAGPAPCAARAVAL